MLIGSDIGPAGDATTDLWVDDIDPVSGSPEIALVFGDSSRTMDDIGFPLGSATGFLEATAALCSGFISSIRGRSLVSCGSSRNARKVSKRSSTTHSWWFGAKPKASGGNRRYRVGFSALPVARR